MLRLSQRVYVVVHRANIVGCQYFPFTIRNSSIRIDMGTLRLDKDVTRQRMDSISVGILDARHGASTYQMEAIEEWITCDNIALLTGHFGCDMRMVEQIAKGAMATFCESLAQWMIKPRERTAVAESRSRREPQSRVLDAFAHPTFFSCLAITGGFNGRMQRMSSP